MLSFQEWKQLNENIGMPMNLGLGQKYKLGNLQNKWDEMGMAPMQSKKMMDMAPPDDGSGGGGMPTMLKKKKKAPMGDSGFGFSKDQGDEEDQGDDEELDMGDSEEGDDEELDMGDDDEGDEEDMDDDEEGGDEEGLGDDEGDEGGDEEGLGDVPPEGDVGDDLSGGNGMKPKKKKMAPPMPQMGQGQGGMAPQMMKARMMKKESADPDECGCCKNCKTKGKKCKCKCKDCKHSKKEKLTKEDRAWLQSVQSQTGGTQFYRDEYGEWLPVQEDTIIPPSNPNAKITVDDDDDEPQPGQPGYAPQGRVGSFFGGYSEWSKKFRGKRLNESVKRKKSKKSKSTWFK